MSQNIGSFILCSVCLFYLGITLWRLYILIMYNKEVKYILYFTGGVAVFFTLLYVELVEFIKILAYLTI